MIIVVHPREKKRKCTVRHLREQPGYIFWRFPRRGDESVQNYVRIGMGGDELGPADADTGLLILDGTWKLAHRMEPFFQDIPLRSLGPWQTAYPRTSKVFDDPEGGLATVEAIYAAQVQVGRSTTGLLDNYHWANEFVSINADLIDYYRQRIEDQGRRI